MRPFFHRRKLGYKIGPAHPHALDIGPVAIIRTLFFRGCSLRRRGPASSVMIAPLGCRKTSFGGTRADVPPSAESLNVRTPRGKLSV